MEAHSGTNIVEVIFSTPSCTSQPTFSDYSSKLPRIIFAPVDRCMLNRKPDYTPKGMLVTLEYAIDSSTYGNIAFAGISKKGNFRVYQEDYSITSYGMYFAKLANPAKRRISTFTRERVNSLITGCA